MKEHNNHLSRAYELEKPEDIQNFYSDWAKTYDAEVLENGYITPERCAAALAEFTPTQDLSLLDIGCGTGLSGKRLAEAGFTRIDGCDLNHDMLEVASMGLHVGQMTGQSEMREAFRAVTSNGAKALGLQGYGTEVGCNADLVVLQARDEIEALRLRPNRLAVFRRGQKIATTPEQTATVFMGKETFPVDFTI